MTQPLPNSEDGPTDEEIEARMRPGAFSKAGFLGPGEKLSDVIAADSEVVRNLNLTCTEIASKLDALITAAEISPTREARLGTLHCQIQVHQGFQICPWASDPNHQQCSAGLGVRHASVDWWIANAKTGEGMRGPGLIVHLIRDHHFFEGPTSSNRVDPSRIARLVELL